MIQIITGIILFIIGIAFQMNANMSAKYSFEQRPGFLVFGGAAEIAALVLIIIGIKKYYFSEIISELKKISEATKHDKA